MNESEAALPAGARPLIPASVRIGIVGSFMILAIGALYYARSFFLPVVLSVLITLALAPAVRRLARVGIPAFASALLFIVVLAGALAIAAMLFAPAVSSVMADAPHIVKELRDRFAFLQTPFNALNNIGRQFGELGRDGQPVQQDTPQPVIFAQPGLISWLAGTAAGVGTTLGATLILSLFLLAQRDTLRLKLIRVMPELHDKKRSLRVLRDIENEVSHYLLTITAINVGVGLFVGLAMAWLGMPNAPLWGFGAALLNYVPFIGPLAGECLALAIAAITFPTLPQVFLPPLFYLVVQMVEANFITPTVLGRRLELNPVAILIALALATWMWGIVGTVIAVPILVVVKVFCDNFETLFALGEFLSAAPVAAEDDEGLPSPVVADVAIPLPIVAGEINSNETTS